MPNILVVENNSGLDKSLAHRLRENLRGSLEWTILEAESGDGALKTLFSSNVHLVITSLHAPGVSNGGLLSEISTDETLRDIPVMALSDGKDEEKEALRQGAVDFMLTPINDYDVFTAKAVNHAIRNIRTVNLKRAAEFVALLKDLDNVKNAMAESLTDFGHQMHASAVSVMTKEGPSSWRLYLTHNIAGEARRFFEKIENCEPKFFAALSSGRKGIGVKDVNSDEMIDMTLEPVIKRLGAESILGLPLLSDDKVMGCIIFFFESKRSFSEQEITDLMSTVPGMVYAIENSQKVGDLRSELLTAWKIGADSLRKLGLFPDKACEGCSDICDDCSTLSGKGFNSVEGVVSFTRALLDRVLDLSSKVDRHSDILEREVKSRTERLLKEIEERKNIELELQEARKDLEEGVALRTIALQETNAYLIQEVADRKKAETAVREAHMQTEQLLAAISSIFISVDSNGNVTRWNEAATDTFGIAAAAMVGQPFMGCGIRWDWSIFRKEYLNCDLLSKACRIESMRYTRPNGESGFLGLTLSPVAAASVLNDETPGFILLGSDITMRKIYQDQLRLADIVYQNTIEGIMVTDDSGIIQSVNPAFSKITGYEAEEAAGKSPKIYSSSQQSDLLYEEIWDSLKSNGQWVGEVWNKRKNGETYLQWLTIVGVKDDVGKVTQYLAVIRDVTEIKRAEEELGKQREILLQSEKLAGLGELASGVAHELNQPLNHIKITCQILVKMLQRDFFDKGAMIDEVLVVVDNVQRAVEIIHTMRDFARKDNDTLASVDVRQAITNSIKMFGSQLKTHNISLHFTAPKKPVEAICSINKLSQVIVNMITNARDALESCEDKASKNININVLEEGRQVIIRVTDNGSGIPAEILKNIFNPFFTTKATGVGTGLGLSISYKIIQDFGGSLEVESAVNDGTTMKITLNKPTANENE